MKALFFLTLLLSSCIIGVDEKGNYTARPDPYALDKVLEHLIKHEVPARSSKSDYEYVYQLEDGSWVYADGTPYIESLP